MHNSLPLPLVQMGHVEKLAEAAQNHPQVQQQILQETAAQALREQNSQVPATDETEEPLLKDLGDRQEKKRRGRRGSRAKKAGTTEKEETSSPSGSPGGNPWAGNIINVKI